MTVLTEAASQGRLGAPPRCAVAKLPLGEWHAGTSPAALASMVFTGRVLVIRQLPAIDRIVMRARRIVESAFGSDDPQLAERDLHRDAFIEAAGRARRAVAADAGLARLWREALAALGYGEDDCYADRLRLRVVPSDRIASPPELSALPPHRDNWASGVAAQINWWLPLYPLVGTRTMLIWPDLFHSPVPNDSDSWKPAAAHSPTQGNARLLPCATAMPDSAGRPVRIEPGSLLAFSGAQLHSSTNDDAGISRLSLDTRTVSADDVRCGRGAANVDGAGQRPHYEWFRHRKDPDGALLAALAARRQGGAQ